MSFEVDTNLCLECPQFYDCDEHKPDKICYLFLRTDFQTVFKEYPKDE